MEQVRSNTGSTEHQRSLAELPRQWGWPESHIILIEDDLGLSGTSSGNRLGFQRLLSLIDRGTVSIVLVRDVSRISRDPLDAEIFTTKAKRAGILIFAHGRIYDTSTKDLTELFGLRLMSMFASLENDMRTQMMQQARLAKVNTKGLAVSRPPIGFVESVKGKWIKDPQPEVADAIRHVVHLALTLTSINKIRNYMREHDLRFPRRVQGQIVWARVTRTQINRILTNSAYVGDYVYGRARIVKSDTGERTLMRPPSEWHVIPDHHEAYMSRDEFETIRTLLAARRRTVRQPIGRGAALLQGIIWCALCDRPMGTTYGIRGPNRRRIPTYGCRPSESLEKPTHYVTISHRAVDEAVVRFALPRLKSIDLQTARAVIEESHQEWEVNATAQRRQLQRLEDDVRQRRRSYDAVDPDHRLVKVDLEGELDRARQCLEEARRGFEENRPRPAVTLDPADIAELVDLVARIEELWAAPTTTNEDKKSLLQAVISRVAVRSTTNHSVETDIVWVGGGSDRLEVLRPQGVEQLVDALRKNGLSHDEIIEELKRSGIRNRDGRPLTEAVIDGRLRSLGWGRRAEWIPALLRVRALILERRTGKEILAILRAEGPRHPKGLWTRGQVDRACRTLRSGTAPKGIPPLPSGFPANPGKERGRALLVLMEQGLAAGQTWRDISDDLNARGLKPPRAEIFTPAQVRALYKLWRHKFLSIGAQPSRSATGITFTQNSRLNRKLGQPPERPA
jgi:DNA invertase Pin-like site-specific DNA recombinase